MKHKDDMKTIAAMHKAVLAMFDGRLKTTPSRAALDLMWFMKLIEVQAITVREMEDIPPGSLIVHLSESGAVLARGLARKRDRERAAKKAKD